LTMKDLTLASLGKVLDHEMPRDAVHISVAPVICGEDLSPGMHVSLTGDEIARRDKPPIGIVDPYLPGPVKKGARVWLLLYPGSITSLVHHWTHPAFAAMADDPKVKAKAWVGDFANVYGLSYDGIMDAAATWLQGEEYAARKGSKYVDYDDYGYRYPTDLPQVGSAKWEEFWQQHEILTGKRSKEKAESFFWCSC
jgi:hypothetical protein